MIQPKRPVVLTIDDDDQNATELKLQKAVDVLARKPAEVTTADPEKAQRFVSRLLATPPQQPWGSRAAADVETCHPPIHEWAASTHGMALLRWLLHQVLPYPSFLWEDRYLAARLCVKVESLRQAL